MVDFDEMKGMRRKLVDGVMLCYHGPHIALYWQEHETTTGMTGQDGYRFNIGGLTFSHPTESGCKVAIAKWFQGMVKVDNPRWEPSNKFL